jgi:hypothetical protein
MASPDPTTDSGVVVGLHLTVTALGAIARTRRAVTVSTAGTVNA